MFYEDGLCVWVSQESNSRTTLREVQATNRQCSIRKSGFCFVLLKPLLDYVCWNVVANFIYCHSYSTVGNIARLLQTIVFCLSIYEFFINNLFTVGNRNYIFLYLI